MIGNMKVKTIFFLLVIGMLILSACTPQQTTKTESAEVKLPKALEAYNVQMAPKTIPQNLANDGTHKATFALEGMTCPSCALGIEYQWKQLDGVYDAQINYPEGTGFVVYDTAKLSAEAIAAASTIYPARVTTDESYTQ